MTLSPRHLLPRLAPLLALLAVLALFAALIAPSGRLGSFLSLPNLQVLLHANTIAGVAALGMLLVIVSGGIDLSVGSVVALVTVVTMTAYNAVYVRTGSQLQASLAAVPLGVSAGGLCGLTNGLIIVLGRVRPFVATLGMLSVARGVAIGLAGRQTINFAPGGRPGWVDLLAESESAYFLFSPGFWSLLLLAALAAVLLRWTVLGRHIYAVGGNEQAAWLCGVPVGRTKVIVYTLAGLLTGWAGVLSFAEVGIGDPSGNVGLELIVIAAVVIGGASLSGGQGNVPGTLLGVLIWGVIDNGVSTFNASVEVKYVLVGAFFIINTALPFGEPWPQRYT